MTSHMLLLTAIFLALCVNSTTGQRSASVSVSLKTVGAEVGERFLAVTFDSFNIVGLLPTFDLDKPQLIFLLRQLQPCLLSFAMYANVLVLTTIVKIGGTAGDEPTYQVANGMSETDKVLTTAKWDATLQFIELQVWISYLV